MKKNIYLDIALFFGFLILLSYEEKSIEKDIYIKNEKYPCVNLNIGTQGNKNFLISLLYPITWTFPYNDQDYRYNKEKSDTYNPQNQMYSINYENEDYNATIDEENFKFDNNNITLNFSVVVNEIINMPETAGILGLAKGPGLTKNFNNKYLFLNQLAEKNLISNKNIYIEPYYKNHKLLNQSKIIIGEIPNKYDGDNKKKLPSCKLDKESKDFYKCNMSGFIVENIKDNTTYYNKTKDEEMILAVMEEGEIKTNSIPYFYYEKYFKEYFIDEKKCTFDDSRIKCTNKLDFIENTNISIILGDYQFILSPESAWDGDKLNFVFSKENITRLSSSFLGNYYRIYDINEEKIYFSEVDGNIVLFNPNVTLVWVIIVLIVFLVLVICIIISILLTRTKNKKDLDEKVKTASFKDDRDESEIKGNNGEANLLSND